MGLCARSQNVYVHGVRVLINGKSGGREGGWPLWLDINGYLIAACQCAKPEWQLVEADCRNLIMAEVRCQGVDPDAVADAAIVV